MAEGPLHSVVDDLTPLLEARCGQTFDDRWTLDQIVGVGGMSAVYTARHRNGRRVAIKVLHPTLALMPAARRRFLREGYLANRVEHPGLVQVLDEGETSSGDAYLVMELLEGETLEQHVARVGCLPVSEALAIVATLLDALGASHAAGLVHRDIKPANVMLLHDGRLKLLDFGIATLSANALATQHGTRGTPAFMAPEQARGETASIDARTDLWAVGALLFFLLSGRSVREGGSPEALIFEAATRPVRSLALLSPGSPPEVVSLVDRALAFDPDDRFPDADTMRREIAPLASSVASLADLALPPVSAQLAARPSRPSPLPTLPTLPTQSTFDPAPSPRPRRPHRLARAAAVFPVALLLALSWRALHRSPTTRPSDALLAALVTPSVPSTTTAPPVELATVPSPSDRHTEAPDHPPHMENPDGDRLSPPTARPRPPAPRPALGPARASAAPVVASAPAPPAPEAPLSLEEALQRRR